MVYFLSDLVIVPANVRFCVVYLWGVADTNTAEPKWQRRQFVLVQVTAGEDEGRCGFEDNNNTSRRP